MLEREESLGAVPFAAAMCASMVSPDKCTLEAGLFLCADKTCLNSTVMCDGTPDCKDKSDELAWCNQACKEHQCQQVKKVSVKKVFLK